MFRRMAGGVALLASTLALSVPSTWTPAVADDGPTVHITAPDEIQPGQEATISVTLTATDPVSQDDFPFLDVGVPARLDVESVDGHGNACSVPDRGPSEPSDVECVVPGLTGSTTVDITVLLGPGDDRTETVSAQFQVGEQGFFDSTDVHLVGTPSGLALDISAPERVRPGQRFAVTVKAHADHPAHGVPVGIGVDLPRRLTATAASAPGFECTTRKFQEVPGGFNPAGANCHSTDLDGDVTMTVQVTVEKGAGALDTIDAGLTVGNSSTSNFFDVIILGSGPTTTVSGRVWRDLDRDGRQDPGEPGVPGVQVDGVEASGVSVAARTGTDGKYVLEGIEETRVQVGFFADRDLRYSKPNVGDDRHDSDVTSVARDCQDCNVGFVSLDLKGPATFVDAGLFDPKVPPTQANPGPGGSGSGGGAPTGSAQGDRLAATGVPVVGLVGIGGVLLAAGAGLVVVTRRRSARAGS